MDARRGSSSGIRTSQLTDAVRVVNSANASRSCPRLHQALTKDAFSITPDPSPAQSSPAHTGQLRPLGLAQRGVTGVVAGLEHLDPPAQRRLRDADLTCTTVTRRPVLITSFTASSLYSGSAPGRCLRMINLPAEVFTERVQSQNDAAEQPNVVETAYFHSDNANAQQCPGRPSCRERRSTDPRNFSPSA